MSLKASKVTSANSSAPFSAESSAGAHQKAAQQLEQRLRQQRDQLNAALQAISQLEQPARDISVPLATLHDTSIELSGALQLADDLAAWCAATVASHAPETTSAHADYGDMSRWLEPLHMWAAAYQWPLSGHAPHWHVGMISLVQRDSQSDNQRTTNQRTTNQRTTNQHTEAQVLELWLGDKHEYICTVPAEGQTLIAYLEALLTRPLPEGFVAALQDSIHALSQAPAAPVLDVFSQLKKRLGETLAAHMPTPTDKQLSDTQLSNTQPANHQVAELYNTAAFAYDLYRVKTTANLRFVAASRAHKQRLWIPHDRQGQGMVCGWLAC